MFILFFFNLCFNIFNFCYFSYKLKLIDRDIDTLFDKYAQFEYDIMKICRFYSQDNNYIVDNSKEVKKWKV